MEKEKIIKSINSSKIQNNNSIKTITLGVFLSINTILANTNNCNVLFNSRGNKQEQCKVNYFNRFLKSISNKTRKLDLTEYNNLFILSKKINALVNFQIKYTSDLKLYNKKDYWATGIETISNRKGDCDDYALLKREILIKFGLDPNQVIVCYGFLLKNGNRQAHLVTGVKTEKGLLILDNTRNIPYLAEDNQKYIKLIYYINEQGLYNFNDKEKHRNNYIKQFRQYKENKKKKN